MDGFKTLGEIRQQVKKELLGSLDVFEEEKEKKHIDNIACDRYCSQDNEAVFRKIYNEVQLETVGIPYIITDSDKMLINSEAIRRFNKVKKMDRWEAEIDQCTGETLVPFNIQLNPGQTFSYKLFGHTVTVARPDDSSAWAHIRNDTDEKLHILPENITEFANELNKLLLKYKVK